MDGLMEDVKMDGENRDSWTVKDVIFLVVFIMMNDYWLILIYHD